MKYPDYENRILCGHTLEKRNKKGQFSKGYTYRKPKPYWNEEWLYNEYIIKEKSANQIAQEQKCTENNILFYLKKLKISTRSMSDIRKKKYWGLKGKQNGMYGKTGRLNPNWQGGCSPERQSLYARSVWKELMKAILKRDNYTCQKCGYYRKDNKHKLIVHHKKRWSKYPELRFEPSNLITLCERCHKNVHKN